MQAFDSIYFLGKSHFEGNGTQNYLVFQTMYRYFRKFVSNNHISAWKSKGLSDESTNPPGYLVPSLNCIDTKTIIKCDGSCLKQDKATFTNEKAASVYIVYEINLWDCGYDGYLTLENSLFGQLS